MTRVFKSKSFGGGPAAVALALRGFTSNRPFD